MNAASQLAAAEEKALPPAAATDVDFKTQIAPLLTARCLGCHGAEKAESGLRLHTAESLLKGSDSGPVIANGNSAESRLIQVVAGVADDDVSMPPEGDRLTAEQIGLLRAWIDQGANWPAELVLAVGAITVPTKGADLWSLQPVRRTSPPAVRHAEAVRNGIDRFIVARLEAEGIEPSLEAGRAALIRRLSLDLIGLPPAPDEVAQFVDDASPDAYERLVERLLASPHYGERWARPWLDLCHYADTDGYLTDQLRPVAWRYRQWLVEALNRDLPFDQFTTWQLAGDLLPDSSAEQSQATDRPLATDQLLATGFLRNTLSNREGGADLEEFRVEQIIDRTMMFSTTWLGLTVGCARCHDHKYDPVSQKEFYQLYAYFDAADEVNLDAPLPGEWEPYQAALPEYQRKRAELLAPLAKDLAELQDRWEKRLLQAVANPGQDSTWDRQWEVLGLIWGGNLGEGQLEGTQIVLLDPARRTQDQQDRLLDYFLKQGSVIDSAKFAELKLSELSAQLEKLKADLPKLTRAPAMRETQNPRAAYLHVRGDFRVRGLPVQPGTPAVLPPLPGDSLPADSSLNRLALARWLTSAENPLTARVTVNRSWQEFFGRGLVLSSENFGMQGERPSHPELLDWLACEFRDCGWSVKALHRLIVTSATYRQSSHARPELAARDPNNVLLARQSSLRLSSEQIRDVTLAASGLLDWRMGGPSVYPPQPESVALEGFDNKWTPSEGGDRFRRGLYTYIQRLSPYALNVTFDAPALSRSCTRRDRSNTPLQALTLLNDPVFFEAAQSLAARLLREAPATPSGRIERGFQICLSRPPTPQEQTRLAAYYDEQLALLRADPAAAEQISPNRPEGLDPAEAAAWTAVASVLLNLHEFITRD